MSYNIGEVSKQFNLSIHTLRYYEKEGILNIKRSKSGIRKYEDSDINTIKIVECLKSSGMQLKDIKQFIDWCNLGNETLELRQAMFENQRKIVLQKLEEIQKTLDVINYKCWYYKTANELGNEEFVKNLDPSYMPEPILKIYKEMHGDNIDKCCKGA